MIYVLLYVCIVGIVLNIGKILYEKQNKNKEKMIIIIIAHWFAFLVSILFWRLQNHSLLFIAHCFLFYSFRTSFYISHISTPSILLWMISYFITLSIIRRSSDMWMCQLVCSMHKWAIIFFIKWTSKI